MLKASVAEGVGKNAKGAAEKIAVASEEALADIAKATQRYVRRNMTYDRWQWLHGGAGEKHGIC